MELEYKKLTGIVNHLEKFEEGTIKFASEPGEEPAYYVNVHDSNTVFDTHGVHVFLEEGKTFHAFVASNKPMILIHPPQYSPDLVVLESEELSFVEIHVFNEELVSGNNLLKLNVDETTKIVDLSGAELKVDAIAGHHAAVFYDSSTRSIPAQATPKKIIVLQ